MSNLCQERPITPCPDTLSFAEKSKCEWQKAKLSGEWKDWRWQFRNRIKDADTLAAHLDLLPEEEKALRGKGKNLPLAITPYYLSIIDPTDPADPIRKTVIPTTQEFITSEHEMIDPCGEEGSSPVPGLVHRYPDRVLFLVNDMCSVYCRYCTRSRVVGSGDLHTEFGHVYQYLREHTEVRDVLISGGDPLVFSDDRLEDIISNLRAIPHIEIIRLGTKVPVVLPQRVTENLVNMLKKYQPIFMSIHFMHPTEITPEVTEACNRLADAGIPTFSQTVLLKGVNDNPDLMKRLMQKILMLRVRPYYIYQCDPVEGTSHFRTDVKTGLDIMHNLRGHTTGYAIPTYVIDAPGGGGKIPVTPDYIVSENDHEIKLKNYAGEEYTYFID